jgi:hypothetical protein
MRVKRSLLGVGLGDQMILERVEHMEKLRELGADAYRAIDVPLIGLRAF